MNTPMNGKNMIMGTFTMPIIDMFIARMIRLVSRMRTVISMSGLYTRIRIFRMRIICTPIRKGDLVGRD